MHCTVPMTPYKMMTQSTNLQHNFMTPGSWRIPVRGGYRVYWGCTPVSTCYIDSRNAKVPGFHWTFSFAPPVVCKVGCVIFSCAFSSMLAVHQTVEMRARSFWPWFANDFTPFDFIYERIIFSTSFVKTKKTLLTCLLDVDVWDQYEYTAQYWTPTWCWCISGKQPVLYVFVRDGIIKT